MYYHMNNVKIMLKILPDEAITRVKKSGKRKSFIAISFCKPLSQSFDMRWGRNRDKRKHIKKEVKKNTCGRRES